jgi:PAS domain S-box-containing protein
MEDIIGKKDEDLFPEEIAEETVSDDRHVIKTGIPLVNKEEGGESFDEGGHWVSTTKLQTNEFYLDPNVKAILGYSDAEIPNDIEVWSNYVHPDDKQPVMEAFQDHIDGKTTEFAYKHRMLHKDGSIRWIMARGTALRDDQGNPVRVVGTDTDITQHQQAEEALREKDKKLERQAKNLIEMNTALKVLLEQREKEKIEIKENLVADIKKLVYPYIEQLGNINLNQDAQTFVNIIKSNINDLISPFATTLSSKYFSLTPSEIQIADLIKHGKTSKEIASILNVSPKAISFHRGNLRKKLGLLNKKINLRTYLQTFPH